MRIGEQRLFDPFETHWSINVVSQGVPCRKQNNPRVVNNIGKIL